MQTQTSSFHDLRFVGIMTIFWTVDQSTLLYPSTNTLNVHMKPSNERLCWYEHRKYWEIMRSWQATEMCHTEPRKPENMKCTIAGWFKQENGITITSIIHHAEKKGGKGKTSVLLQLMVLFVITECRSAICFSCGTQMLDLLELASITTSCQSFALWQW